MKEILDGINYSNYESKLEVVQREIKKLKEDYLQFVEHEGSYVLRNEDAAEFFLNKTKEFSSDLEYLENIESVVLGYKKRNEARKENRQRAEINREFAAKEEKEEKAKEERRKNLWGDDYNSIWYEKK